MRIWHAFELKAHLENTFKLSTDPAFIDKVQDIVGLYLNPPEKVLVLCTSRAIYGHIRFRGARVSPCLRYGRDEQKCLYQVGFASAAVFL